MDIGILIPAPFDRIDTRLAISLEHLCRYALKLGHRCLPFTLEDIDLEKDRILAYQIQPEDGETTWTRDCFPVPPLVYNRIDNRSLQTEAQRDAFEELVRHLYFRSPQVKVFNLHSLDKYEVYQLLSKHKETEKLLPETQLYSPDTLPGFLEKHSPVYLKPLDFSLGLGICQVARAPEKGFYVKFHIHKRLYQAHCPDLQVLRSFLTKILLKEQYLMQEGIDFATIEDRPFMFRVHLFKKQPDDWQVSAISGKLGRKNQYLVTWLYGATLTDYRQLLDKAFGPEARRV